MAAADLSISATHSRGTLLKVEGTNTTVNPATLTLKVSNAGADPTSGVVTVADPLPTGLVALINDAPSGAGAVAASGSGWTCVATTCTRSDALAPGASYPEIKVTVKTANTAAASVTNAVTVSGGGDADGASASDVIAIVTDACTNGWAASEKIQFAPPVPAIDSGVLNVERMDGCTVLDKIWEAEPFASHAAFVAHVTSVLGDFSLTPGEKDSIVSAATQSLVGTSSDHQVDNSCTNRVAFTFDDGPSMYRPRTLQYFRDKQVHGDFFDLGMRAEANPDIERFTVAEGHVLLSHTYNHTDMNALSDAAKIEEIKHNENVFNAMGAPFTFKGIRTPFGSANTHTQEVVAAQGYTYFLTRIETGADYEPVTTAQQTADGIISRFRPGAIIGIHDGPIDTPAGLATSDAVPMIIDRGRAMGYCFGKVDRSGQVVADRYVSSDKPIPQATNPVPYNFLERAGTPPGQWFVAPDGLAIDATHSPAVFTRGGNGTITINVSSLLDVPSDADPVGGSTVTVTDAVPTGLTVVSASGPGWTCTGTRTRTCTRTDTLAPRAAYPPITIAVTAATNAPGVVSNVPKYIAHGQSWANIDTDPISVGVPATGDVGGSVPATLSLVMGQPATFGAFTPGVAKDYTASTTASVTSTAGDAALSVSGPLNLTNGAFSLPSPLAVDWTPKTWSAPVSNDVVAISLKQHIGAGDALRTGAYSTTLTWTLSTTTP
ncbi:MAG TPA: polysaccharide deacetylase family protein [Solirubrobacter sp.]